MEQIAYESTTDKIKGQKKTDAVSVAIRVRPQSARERAENATICVSVIPDKPQIIIGRDKAFTYDYVFDELTTQPEVYEACVHSLLEGTFEGYNATVFAYGQTGSGKTYTMGTGFEVNQLYNTDDEQLVGIVPRAATHLFDGIAERQLAAITAGRMEPTFEIGVQFIELYNEEIIDLLADVHTSSGTTTIKIHEDPVRNEIHLRGAVWRAVQSADDIMGALKMGSMIRTTAATNMHQQSSRSHAIFSVQLKQTRMVPLELEERNTPLMSIENNNQGATATELEVLHAKFHFVDLAGSERLKRTGATGDRAKEGISINSGLLALGNVISALGSGRSAHVPYRDSKLTRLLQDSLGGNSRTLMIACVSPCDIDYVETLNTLNYANRAKNIKNKLFSQHYRALDANRNLDQTYGGIIPPLTDITQIPHARKQWLQWYTEVSKQCPAVDSMEIDASEEAPDFNLNGPDDFDSIQCIREFFSDQMAKQHSLLESIQQNGNLFDAKLKQRFCTADLDRQRIQELEEECRRLKGTSSAMTGELRHLKRENNALRVRLYKYEQVQEQQEQRDQGQRYVDAEREAALKSNRRTLQKVAELFESPIPTTTNVARLRKKFGSNLDLLEEGDDGVAKKTPRMDESSQPREKRVAANNYNSNSGAITVRMYDAGQGTPRTGFGFVNTRYHRRSRSAGTTPRVINHQPLNKIPLGTVFQPKLRKATTKHTTHVEAKDLKSHDEYMVTRQEVDDSGHLRTKLIKGEVVPTAGGGSSVHFIDAENLYQESP